MNPFKSQKRKLKRSIAKATGVPTTKSGRKKKANRVLSENLGWVDLIGFIIYVFVS